MHLPQLKILYWVKALFLLATILSPQLEGQEGIPDGVWVRPGFELTVAESTIKKPRFLEFDDQGTLFVSVPAEGKIQACRDEDGDGIYESITTYVEGYKTGKILQAMQFYKGWLWFADMTSIYKSRDQDHDGQSDEVIKVIAEDKMQDLNAFTIESAMKMVAGTARSMGFTVSGGKSPF